MSGMERVGAVGRALAALWPWVGRGVLVQAVARAEAAHEYAERERATAADWRSVAREALAQHATVSAELVRLTTASAVPSRPVATMLSVHDADRAVVQREREAAARAVGTRR